MTKNTRRFAQRTALLAAAGASSLLGFLATPAEAAGPPANHDRTPVHMPHGNRPVGPIHLPADEWPW